MNKFNPNLPFFTYGLFNKGNIGILNLQENIKKTLTASIKGNLLQRDGLPLLDIKGNKIIEGNLIYFQNNLSKKGYKTIEKIEPQHQYRWEMISVDLENKRIDANVLAGNNLDKGTVVVDESGGMYSSWTTIDDPYFSSVPIELRNIILDSEVSESPKQSKKDLTLTEYQMLYTMLWVCIERFMYLRFGPEIKIRGNKRIYTTKVWLLKDEKPFKDHLATITRNDSIVEARNPDEEHILKESVDSSYKYYREMRNNIMHRGKAGFHQTQKYRDIPRLRSSFEELYIIFSKIIINAHNKAGMSHESLKPYQDELKWPRHQVIIDY